MNICCKLFAVGILATSVLHIGSAQAATWGNCYWDGSSPFCAGTCERGFSVRKSVACFSGRKVWCCEKTGSVSQYQKRR